jgi:hypothetical protein
VLGLAAFGLVVVVMFRSLSSAWRNAGSTVDRTLAAALIAVFGGYLAHSLLDVSYYDYKILLLFWLLVGSAAVIGQRLPHASETGVAGSQLASSA